MPHLTRRTLAIAAASFALALSGCGQANGAGGAAGTAVSGDMTLGDPNAPVKVVEYASLTCPHCAAFHNEVFPEFKKKYVDTGKVHYTFKEFLTPPAAVAAAGSLLARCAGKDKYFDVISAVFHSQSEWGTSGPRESLLRVAKSAGMTEEQFDKCVGDREALQALNARVEKSAKEADIQFTPTFVINGKKAKEGAMTMAELDAAIAAASK
ncbi:DsbA family protein [Phenylobacterium terrae]|uniref:DsbA family protein n=1 Tax=Phenylobacterium terrae TaxID=2665495 RepID=A0ABW4N2B7_9CAUL